MVRETFGAARRKLPDAGRRLVELFEQAPPEIVRDRLRDETARLAPEVNAKDAPIVAAALDAGVDYFVTGDLRRLKEVRRLPGAPRSVSPRQLLDVIEATGP